MKQVIEYERGVRVFKPKEGLLMRVVRLSSDTVIQTGQGLEKARSGYFVVTMPSGQQFPISPNNFEDMFEGVPGVE